MNCEVILIRKYQDHVISTKMKKRTLKKLILDTCTKTGFLFNNTFYQQKYSVSMSSCLGPVLTNNIMTELEDVIITIMFYGGFVDDT